MFTKVLVFSKVLVANRGEIAVRVLRACAELGIPTVAIYSTVDSAAHHVRLADESVGLPGATASESYLRGDAVIDAARELGVDAIHPGYGFLAENADFARAVEDAGITFIGPPASAMTSMGNKETARRIAQDCGVPVLPGINGPIRAAADVRAFGDQNGWPVIIKATHGGGGRGMRVVRAPAEADEMLTTARRESAAATGHDEVYLERYLEAPRHIEVQIIADKSGRVLALGDRDCSVQRRHQKLIEEAPAPGLPEDLRSAMGEAATRIAESVGYVGLGTVEFLVDGDNFHFLEMNTRIQVEHPVTELVLGVDLVHEQLLLAAGEPLSLSSSRPRGHAIECRINAEDSRRGFLPTPGVLHRLEVPHGPGIRFDGGYRQGDRIPSEYDNLIGKLLCWGPTREIAVRRMRDALSAARIDGVATTIPAAAVVLAHPDHQRASISTRWFEEVVEPTLSQDPQNPATDGAPPPDDRVASINGRTYRIPRTTSAPAGSVTRPVPRQHRTRSRGNTGGGQTNGQVTSPIQGTVTTVEVGPGSVVEAGGLLLTMEAMKMEVPVRSPHPARVATVEVKSGDSVAPGTLLVTLASVSGRPPRAPR